MARMKSKKLTLLGRRGPLPVSPAAARIETVPNPAPRKPYLVRFTCPEFTALCPVTGQPDFAHFVIDYVPARTLIESKSLKLFLASFRNHRAFHEDCTMTIADRLLRAAASRSTCSTNRGRRPKRCGFPNRVSPLIAAADLNCPDRRRSRGLRGSCGSTPPCGRASPKPRYHPRIRCSASPRCSRSRSCRAP